MRPLFETSFGDGLFIVRVSLICQPAATLGSPKIDLAASCNGRRAPSQAKHPHVTKSLESPSRSPSQQQFAVRFRGFTGNIYKREAFCRQINPSSVIRSSISSSTVIRTGGRAGSNRGRWWSLLTKR